MHKQLRSKTSTTIVGGLLSREIPSSVLQPSSNPSALLCTYTQIFVWCILPSLKVNDGIHSKVQFGQGPNHPHISKMSLVEVNQIISAQEYDQAYICQAQPKPKSKLKLGAEMAVFSGNLANHPPPPSTHPDKQFLAIKQHSYQMQSCLLC